MSRRALHAASAAPSLVFRLVAGIAAAEQLLGVLHQEVDLLLAVGVVDEEQRGPAHPAKFEQRFLVGGAAEALLEHGFEGGEVAADLLDVGVGHGVQQGSITRARSTTCVNTGFCPTGVTEITLRPENLTSLSISALRPPLRADFSTRK